MIKLLILFTFVFTCSVFSQLEKYYTTPVTLKVVVGDMYFIEETIKTIDIEGKEVDLFLELQDKIKLVTENQQVKVISRDSVISISIEFGYLMYIKKYLSQAKFPAYNAVRYKRFIALINQAESKFLAILEEQKKTPGQKNDKEKE